MSSNLIDQANRILETPVDFFDEQGADVKLNFYTTLFKADQLIKKFKDDLSETVRTFQGSSTDWDQKVLSAETKFFRIQVLLTLSDQIASQLEKISSELQEEGVVSSSPRPIMTKEDINAVAERIQKLARNIQTDHLNIIPIVGVTFIQKCIDQLKDMQTEAS